MLFFTLYLCQNVNFAFLFLLYNDDFRKFCLLILLYRPQSPNDKIA